VLIDAYFADGAAKVKHEQVTKEAKRLFVVDTKSQASPSGDGGAVASTLSRVAVVCEKERRIPSYLQQSEILSRIGD